MKITDKGIAILENDHCICKWVEEEGRLDHDQNLLPHVLRHINKGDTVVDCGAFIGDHTIAYANKVGITGLVLAFEPSKEAFECLAYNTEKYDNIGVLQFGLGAKEEKKGITHVETNEGMNYLSEGEEIQVLTIDSLKLANLHFLKIDCEGYELEVLKGAEKTIEQFRPKMLIEINDMTLQRAGLTRTDIFAKLDELNYKYANIYPRTSMNEPQLDILCLPLNR